MSYLIALILGFAVPQGDGSVWDRLAQCESNGNWSINTGNGYYGGVQFSLQSWRAVGGPTPYPHQATRSQQIAAAQRLWEIQGWGAWPACSRRLGLSGNPINDSARVDAQADSPEIDPELQPDYVGPFTAAAQVETLSVLSEQETVQQEPVQQEPVQQEQSAPQQPPQQQPEQDDDEALPVTR